MSKTQSSIQAIALILAISFNPSPASADLAAIVSGVSQIVSPGLAGPVFPLCTDWTPLAFGDDDASFPSILVMVRSYGAGRVAAIGHEGLVLRPDLLDNGLFLTNLIYWLDGPRLRAANCTSGHNEWVTLSKLGGLQALLANRGYSLGSIPSPVTTSRLANTSVLIVGNAWKDFSSSEREAVRQFVENGGGLLLVGLGWSWEPHNPGKTIEDYPMMKLASAFNMRWLKSTIADPTDQYEGSPVFHTFYPNVQPSTIEQAFGIISAAHQTHGITLMTKLESEPDLRKSFTQAHALLAVPSCEFPKDDSARAAVYDFYRTLVLARPSSYSRVSSFNVNTYPTSVWVRERFWRTWCDCLELTSERKAEIASSGLLLGRCRDIFIAYSVIVQDNQSLDFQQLDYIHRLLALVPPQLHNLRSLWVLEFLGTPVSPLNLNGLGAAINLFGSKIGDYLENPFPDDVSPSVASLFTQAFHHELNHVVDPGARGDAVLTQRRDAIIARAGADHMNYLRSMIPDGVFLAAPQEFFASISNQWFADSSKTIELGVVRFENGRPEPINQALFFADVYSMGGNHTYFYFSDQHGNLQRKEAPLVRDAAGRIKEIVVEPWIYSFELDADGYVTGITKRSALPVGIDEVKRAPPAKLLIISDACVTASFGDCFYIQSDDRSSGIRVSSPGTEVVPGTRVEVVGTVLTDTNGERYIEAATVTTFSY